MTLSGSALPACSVMPDSCDPMDCSPPGSSVRGILQARILHWVANSYSRGYFWPRIEPASPVSPVLQTDYLPLSHGMTNLKECKRSQMTLLGRFCEKIIIATCYSIWNGPMLFYMKWPTCQQSLYLSLMETEKNSHKFHQNASSVLPQRLPFPTLSWKFI